VRLNLSFVGNALRSPAAPHQEQQATPVHGRNEFDLLLSQPWA